MGHEAALMNLMLCMSNYGEALRRTLVVQTLSCELCRYACILVQRVGGSNPLHLRFQEVAHARYHMLFRGSCQAILARIGTRRLTMVANPTMHWHQACLCRECP